MGHHRSRRPTKDPARRPMRLRTPRTRRQAPARGRSRPRTPTSRAPGMGRHRHRGRRPLPIPDPLMRLPPLPVLPMEVRTKRTRVSRIRRPMGRVPLRRTRDTRQAPGASPRRLTIIPIPTRPPCRKPGTGPRRPGRPTPIRVSPNTAHRPRPTARRQRPTRRLMTRPPRTGARARRPLHRRTARRRPIPVTDRLSRPPSPHRRRIDPPPRPRRSIHTGTSSSMETASRRQRRRRLHTAPTRLPRIRASVSSASRITDIPCTICITTADRAGGHFRSGTPFVVKRGPPPGR